MSRLPLTYAETGVDIDKGDQFVEKISPYAKATRRIGSMDAIGGFGGLFDLKALEMVDPILVAATDGVGSKLDVAMEMQKFDTIGKDLVAMCVNDLICQNAAPLFFLDYLAVNKLDPDQGAELVEGIAKACIESNCQLIGGETAEMPSLYPVGKFDLAGFTVGAVERSETLPRNNIEAGDILMGVASAGLHSNGYSLIHAILNQAKLGLSDNLPNGKNIGDLMLEPTRIYVKSALLAAKCVSAYAHITGGGLIGNVGRILPKNLGVKVNMSEVTTPSLAAFAIQNNYVDVQEAYRVWNMGIGLVAVLKSSSDIAFFNECFEGVNTYKLGEVVEGSSQVYDSKYEALL